MTTNKNFQLIDPKDFQSIKLVVSMQNMTTNTEIREGQRVFGRELEVTSNSEDFSIKIIEFHDQEVKLEVPTGACASGHNVVLTFEQLDERHPENQANVFTSTAKIKETETINRDRVLVTATLVQFDKDSWEAFRSTFSNRQNEIEEFFRAVKGY